MEGGGAAEHCRSLCKSRGGGLARVPGGVQGLRRTLRCVVLPPSHSPPTEGRGGGLVAVLLCGAGACSAKRRQRLELRSVAAVEPQV